MKQLSTAQCVMMTEEVKKMLQVCFNFSFFGCIKKGLIIKFPRSKKRTIIEWTAAWL